MTIARSIIAAAVLGLMTLASAQPAFAAAGGSIFVIYRVPGVLDDGGATNTGVATSVSCTNLSNVIESVNFVIRNASGTIVVNTGAITQGPFQSFTYSTHSTALLSETFFATGILNPGFISIGSTTTEMVCTAMIVDAASASPQGIPLHMMRYNSSPGTQE